MKSLSAFASFVILGATPTLAQTARISESAWLSPKVDLVAFLTTAPAECLAVPKDDQSRALVEIGRVAFRSPFLLGGPAARGRLSCNACHVNGRSNPDFYVEGLSSAPGAADVTSSVFSALREDHILNAKPIPDLIDSAAQAESAHDIGEFIESAVTEEFQGAAPPRAVIDGLTAYVSALRSTACDSNTIRQSPRRDMRHVRRALMVADVALSKGDLAVAEFALLSAQGELGRIAERFPNSVDSRATLGAISRRVAAARSIAGHAPKGARVRVAEIDHDASKLSYALRRRSSDSLYDRDAAAAFLQDVEWVEQ